MRITPANLSVAKSLAKNLREQLEYVLGVEIPYQHSQELYARALGYAHWRELAEVLGQPHPTCYLSDLGERQAADEEFNLAIRLAQLVGNFDTQHRLVMAAGEQAGLGYDLKEAGARKERASPWGLISSAEQVAQGIIRVSAKAHGGYRLDATRRTHMDHLLAAARGQVPRSAYIPQPGKEWYAYGTESVIVEAAFPEHFDRTEAARRLRLRYPHLMPLLCDVSPETFDEQVDTQLLTAFQAQPEHWFIVETVGYVSKPFMGWVAYYALQGADALAWFTHQDVAASERGRYVASRESETHTFALEGDVVTSDFSEYRDVVEAMSRMLLCDLDSAGPAGHTTALFRTRRPYPSTHTACASD